MGTRTLYKLKDMLCQELDEIADKGDLGAGDLDIAHKLTDTVKNIYKIEALDERGYSGNHPDDDLRSYNRGSSYSRRHYVRGHYSRTDATERLRSQLNDMMRETDDDRIRDALHRAMDMMEE